MAAPYELVDMIEVSKNTCPQMHVAMRLLAQRLPMVFSNASRQLLIARNLHRGALNSHVVRLWIAGLDQRAKNGAVLEDRYPLIAMQLLAESPLAQQLAGPDLAGSNVQDCVSSGFRLRKCAGRPALNTSLLAAFYRHRVPGLPPDLISRLFRSERPIDHVVAWLGRADRLRNEGGSLSDVQSAITEAIKRLAALVRDGDNGMPALLRTFMADDIKPQSPSAVARHPPREISILWHQLDKLAAPTVIKVDIRERKPGSKVGDRVLAYWPSEPALSEPIA